ncbi:MAG: hypothetical protein AAGD96_07065 [Chloroflexota bacterium]
MQETLEFEVDASGSKYFVGAADYDPVTADTFLDEICLEFSTDKVRIYYLDIDSAKVVKTQELDVHRSIDEVNDLRQEHAGLYQGTIEGSYFAVDNSQEWSLFYDALEDIFLLHIKDVSRLNTMSDFLIPGDWERA